MTDYTDLGFDKNFTKVPDSEEASNGGQQINIPDNAVTEDKIRDSAVVDRKIKSVSWAKILGGIAKLGGNNNSSGELNIKNASGDDLFNMNSNGISVVKNTFAVQDYNLYNETLLIDTSTDANVHGFDITGSGVPTYFLMVLSVTWEAVTWGAGNFGTLYAYVSPPGEGYSKVVIGDVTSAANFTGSIATVSRTFLYKSGTGTFSPRIYFGISGATGSPTAYVRAWNLDLISLFSPISITKQYQGSSATIT